MVIVTAWVACSFYLQLTLQMATLLQKHVNNMSYRTSVIYCAMYVEHLSYLARIANYGKLTYRTNSCVHVQPEANETFFVFSWNLGMYSVPFHSLVRWLNASGREQEIRGTRMDGAGIHNSLLQLREREPEVRNLGSDRQHPDPCCFSCIPADTVLCWEKSTILLAKVFKGVFFNAMTRIC